MSDSITEKIGREKVNRIISLFIVATMVVALAMTALPNITEAQPMPRTFCGYIKQSNGTVVPNGTQVTIHDTTYNTWGNTTVDNSFVGCNYLSSVTSHDGNSVEINATYGGETGNWSGTVAGVLTWVNITLSGWIEKTPTPKAGGYGEAAVGTGNNIYIVRCYNINDNPVFWCYNPSMDNWTSMNTSGLETGTFRNGASLCWDCNNTIYALLGARYNSDDDNRTLFYRYNISNDTWEQLEDTPHAQGAGNAITFSGYNNYVYAIMGNKDRNSTFAYYNPLNNSWINLTLNPSWDNKTDDGCSLTWTGGEYLYVLRGEYEETIPNGDFTQYHIPTQMWENLTPIPEANGVGDGASLLWIGNWIEGYDDCIFALGGGGVNETPGYNFYYYHINDDTWHPLEDIPYPVGYYVGNRLAYANESIYYWQGTPSSWEGGGNKFCQFKLPSVVYVDDDFNSSTPGWGFDHFDKIQDGIDAVSGSTVYVWDGTYRENVDIGKTVTLIGNGSAVTIVNTSNPDDHVFEVTVDWVNISGFTVENATGTYMAGISLDYLGHCNISDNNASNNYYGIWLYHSSNNTLTGNNASNNGIGIYLYGWSDNNNITGNIVNSNNHFGIRMYLSSSNMLMSNTVSKNNYGIYLRNSDDNTLTGNNANSNNGIGIYLSYNSNDNLIYNNYFNNGNNAYDDESNI